MREAVVSEGRRFPKENCLLAKRLQGLKREKKTKRDQRPSQLTAKFVRIIGYPLFFHQDLCVRLRYPQFSNALLSNALFHYLSELSP